MKKYTFDINTTPSTTISNNANYSKIIDDLINADIKDKNYYLNIGTSCHSESDTSTGDIYLDKMLGINTNKIYISENEGSSDFMKAAKFLSGYNTNTNHPYIYGKTYELADGTPIIFFDDSIQIGFDLYYFKDFGKPTFLNTLSPSIKSTILTIYINGLKITIKK